VQKKIQYIGYSAYGTIKTDFFLKIVFTLNDETVINHLAIPFNTIPRIVIIITANLMGFESFD